MPACHFCSFVHSITTFVLAYVCLNTNKAHFTAYTHIDICFTQTSQCSNKYGDMNSTRLFAYLLFTDWHKLKDRVLYLFTLTISLGAASLNHHFCSRLNVSSKYKQKHTHGMGTQTHANKHTQTKGFIFLLIINYYYFHRLARWRRSWKIIDSYCTPICTLSSQKTRILALNFTSSSWSCICIFDYLVRACVLMCLCVVVRACVLMCLCVLVRACVWVRLPTPHNANKHPYQSKHFFWCLITFNVDTRTLIASHFFPSFGRVITTRSKRHTRSVKIESSIPKWFSFCREWETTNRHSR